MTPIIEIKNLGKKYNITHQRGGYVALRDVLMNVLKSPFSFLKSKAKQVAGIETKEEFWALKDINLEIQKGEVVGIIGANGAGKSTLLKILSQITPPTTGEIRVNGTISSLLEVGTGFHPELTGRENIFLNGAILGMTRSEMAKKFDAIVEFAGIEKFLDTPVKYYSSGMYVRLAFSVAAHLEPDILIVDEVLAVGDAEFQNKCMGKMEEVTKKQGRTILFVSHNMGSIQSLCDRCLLLDSGNIVKDGTPAEVINFYISGKIQKSEIVLKEEKKVEAAIKKIYLEKENGEKTSTVEMGENLCINIEYSINKEIPNMDLAILISKDGMSIFYSYDVDTDQALRYNRHPGEYLSRVLMPTSLFKEGIYTVQIIIGTSKDISDPNASVKFEIINTKYDLSNKSYRSDRPGFIYKDLKWEIIKK